MLSAFCEGDASRTRIQGKKWFAADASKRRLTLSEDGTFWLSFCKKVLADSSSHKLLTMSASLFSASLPVLLLLVSLSSVSAGDKKDDNIIILGGGGGGGHGGGGHGGGMPLILISKSRCDVKT